MVALIARVVDEVVELLAVVVAADEIVVGAAQPPEVVVGQAFRFLLDVGVALWQRLLCPLLGLGMQAAERCGELFGGEFALLRGLVQLRGHLIDRVVVGGGADDGGVGAAHDRGQRAYVAEHRRHARLHGGVCIALCLGACVGAGLRGSLLDILDELLAFLVQVFHLRQGAHPCVGVFLHIVEQRDNSFVDPADTSADREHHHAAGAVPAFAGQPGGVRVLPTVFIAADVLHDMIGKRKPFLTAKRMLSNQTFRDVFKADNLNLDQRLKITSLTFLFTDLKGSTALYERVGDLAAFDLVRAHFRSLIEIIAAEKGAVVKTIGDAVMATFVRPEHALAAGLKMRAAMDGSMPSAAPPIWWSRSAFTRGRASR